MRRCGAARGMWRYLRVVMAEPAPWCSGQACWPLEPATAVRIRSGLRLTTGEYHISPSRFGPSMPPARAATRWDPDPKDPSIRRWRDNLDRGSQATGDAWYRALRRFCAETQNLPQDLLTLKPEALRDVFLDFVS